MLGSDLYPIFAADHQLKATDIDDMDVRDRQAISRVAADFAPDLILHLAALTHVDNCEKEPDAAYHTNTIGTQNVALVCQQLNIPLVYISTLSVFDGAKPEAYTEFDTPNPQSHYSRSKYQGELIVQSLLSRYYIVRAGWMFGGGPEDKKFVAKMIELAQNRPELKAVNDKFGSPTYTADIATGTKNLIETGQYGVYHLVNTGAPISRYQMAQAILEYAGITTCQLKPVSSAEFPLPAPRPRMEAGRNLAAELIGLPPLPAWQDALKTYIQTTLLV